MLIKKPDLKLTPVQEQLLVRLATRGGLVSFADLKALPGNRVTWRCIYRDGLVERVPYFGWKLTLFGEHVARGLIGERKGSESEV